MNLEQTGQIGDTIGGVANFFTLCIAIYVARRALPDAVRTARHDRALVAHAEAATKVWMSTFTLATHMKGMTHASSHPGGSVVDAHRMRLNSIGPAGDDFINMTGLAKLHFHKPVLDALNALWKDKAELVVDLMMQQQTGDAALYAKVYSEKRREHIDGLTDEIMRRLRPYAIPEER